MTLSGYYRVRKRYLLRGWEKLPFAIVDSQKGVVTFVPKAYMAALARCDGRWDFDSPLVSDEERMAAAVLLEKGIIEKCEPQAGILPEQEYRFYPNRYMQSVHWCITGRCNYRCKHCSMYAPQGKYGELSHEAALDVVRQLAECGVFGVNVSGGEPLIRPDFMEIVAALSNVGIVIRQLYTNGLLLTHEVLDGLERFGQHPAIVLSFDGVGHHDWLRGVSGAEEAAYKALKLCLEHDFVAIAQMCLHRGNLNSLRETVNRLASLGCRQLSAGLISNMGNWKTYGIGLALTVDEFFEAALAYIPQYYEDGMPLDLIFPGFFAASTKDPDAYKLVPCRADAGVDHKLVFSCARHLMQLYPDGRPAICDTLGPDQVGMPPIASDDPKVEKTTLAGVLTTGSAYMEL